MTLGGELLAARDDLSGVHRQQRGPDGLEPLGVGEVHPLRALHVHEVPKRGLPEGKQAELHARRVALRLVRHVGPAHVRGRPDGHEQVLDQRPVQHLLGGDPQDHPPPSLDGHQLLLGQVLVGRGLEAERGVEVLTHDRVLELGGLAQQVGQLFAIAHDDRRFLHGRHRIRGVRRASTPPASFRRVSAVRGRLGWKRWPGARERLLRSRTRPDEEGAPARRLPQRAAE